MPPDYLTKTDYIHYLQCSKSLWLRKRKPGVYPHRELSEFQQQIIREGHEVEGYAEMLFPEGVSLSIAQSAAEETRNAVAEGVPVLFQATFETGDGLFARVDILKRLDDGSYALYEVKGSSKIKKDTKHNHIKDVCFQKIALERCGLSVSVVSIIHINPEYTRGDKIDLHSLLKIVNVTDEAIALQDETEIEVDNALTLITTDAIDETGCGCSRKTRSNHCDAFTYFNGDIIKNSVWEIGKIRKKKLCILLDRDIISLTDVPEDVELNDFQSRQVRSAIECRPIINNTRIGEMLGALKYPLYFLDYETAMNAVPRIVGIRPWQQIPFQFSLHILYEGDDLKHVEYVSDSLSEAGEMMPALIDAVSSSGSILSWHASFEKKRNQEMGELYPEYRDALSAINERMFDLEKVFIEAYTDAAFRGSTSIKNVLPVLCPNLSYDNLTVQDGTQAMEQWFAMVASDDEAERGQIRDDLLAYCKMDTLAMVNLYQVLLGCLKKQ